MSFAARCGIDSPERQAACDRLLKLVEASGVDQIRLSWCDLHGQLRGKTLTRRALAQALQNGIGMVSTILLKDTSDRTAYPVFEAGGVADLPGSKIVAMAGEIAQAQARADSSSDPNSAGGFESGYESGFEAASNLVLLPDQASYRQLPWAAQTGWLQCQAWFQSGEPVALDTRRVLQQALAALNTQGFGLLCGLEVEFHIYKIAEGGLAQALDPLQAAWPGPAPDVQMIHPGYNLLSDAWGDQCALPLRIVQDTAQALGLPLTSLEIELGPSQVEAVFDVTDALIAADNMVLFRSATVQALRRAGYHATFMCRPPFPNIMSSGWHLHQSLVQLGESHQSLVQLGESHQSLVSTESNLNAMTRAMPKSGSTPLDAEFTLSTAGAHYLAGLLAHAPAMAALAVPTINGFERFCPHAMAPQAIIWGRDNRGAMLRVIGGAGDSATHIENRVGEPAANPYLYIASQIHAGLDGLRRQLLAPRASPLPYDPSHPQLPTHLGAALDFLQHNAIYQAGLGPGFVDYFCRIKRAELQRQAQSDDKAEWARREYFGRM